MISVTIVLFVAQQPGQHNGHVATVTEA
jgi:hypothetical protein